MALELDEMNVLADTLTEAVRAAVGSGDLTEVRRLLVRATEEDPDGLSWDWMLAFVLLKLCAEAEREGRPGLAAEYSRMASAECSPDIIDGLSVTSLLILGERRGWLHTAEYDQAASLAGAKFPDLLSKLDQLPRRGA